MERCACEIELLREMRDAAKYRSARAAADDSPAIQDPSSTLSRIHRACRRGRMPPRRHGQIRSQSRAKVKSCDQLSHYLKVSGSDRVRLKLRQMFGRLLPQIRLPIWISEQGFQLIRQSLHVSIFKRDAARTDRFF